MFNHELHTQRGRSFSEDVEIRRNALKVQQALDVAEKYIYEYGSADEIARFDAMKAEYRNYIPRDADGYTFAETDYETQTITFYKTMLENDHRVDTVIHEFRHLFPENNILHRRHDFLVPWDQRPIEIDAIKYVDEFYQRMK
jgi:hypothetical protein